MRLSRRLMGCAAAALAAALQPSVGSTGSFERVDLDGGAYYVPMDFDHYPSRSSSEPPVRVEAAGNVYYVPMEGAPTARATRLSAAKRRRPSVRRRRKTRTSRRSSYTNLAYWPSSRARRRRPKRVRAYKPAPRPKTVRVDAVGYYVPLKFEGTAFKSDGYVAGLYGYVGYGRSHSLELGGDFTRINYRQGPHLEQKDGTLIYTNYSIPSWKVRVGGHLIRSDDERSDGAVVGFAGLNRYSPYRWNAGVDLYFSSYAKDEPKLEVQQVSPAAGFSLGKRLYAETRLNAIRLSRGSGHGDRVFRSVRETVSYTHGKVYLSGFFWIGEQVFAVRDGGFTVFNIEEKHIGGYGATIGYDLWKRCRIKAGVSRERFSELGSPRSAAATTGMISLGMRM